MADIIPFLEKIVYHVGQHIFSEGEAANGCFIIKSGEIELTKWSLIEPPAEYKALNINRNWQCFCQPQEVQLSLLTSYQFLGEEDMLRNRKFRSLNANCKSPIVKVYFIKRLHFLRILYESNAVVDVFEERSRAKDKWHGDKFKSMTNILKDDYAKRLSTNLLEEKEQDIIDKKGLANVQKEIKEYSSMKGMFRDTYEKMMWKISVNQEINEVSQNQGDHLKELVPTKNSRSFSTDLIYQSNKKDLKQYGRVQFGNGQKQLFLEEKMKILTRLQKKQMKQKYKSLSSERNINIQSSKKEVILSQQSLSIKEERKTFQNVYDVTQITDQQTIQIQQPLQYESFTHHSLVHSQNHRYSSCIQLQTYSPQSSQINNKQENKKHNNIKFAMDQEQNFASKNISEDPSSLNVLSVTKIVGFQEDISQQPKQKIVQADNQAQQINTNKTSRSNAFKIKAFRRQSDAICSHFAGELANQESERIKKNIRKELLKQKNNEKQCRQQNQKWLEEDMKHNFQKMDNMKQQRELDKIKGKYQFTFATEILPRTKSTLPSNSKDLFGLSEGTDSKFQSIFAKVKMQIAEIQQEKLYDGDVFIPAFSILPFTQQKEAQQNDQFSNKESNLLKKQQLQEKIDSRRHSKEKEIFTTKPNTTDHLESIWNDKLNDNSQNNQENKSKEQALNCAKLLQSKITLRSEERKNSTRASSREKVKPYVNMKQTSDAKKISSTLNSLNNNDVQQSTKNTQSYINVSKEESTKILNEIFNTYVPNNAKEGEQQKITCISKEFTNDILELYKQCQSKLTTVPNPEILYPRKTDIKIPLNTDKHTEIVDKQNENSFDLNKLCSSNKNIPFYPQRDRNLSSKSTRRSNSKFETSLNGFHPSLAPRKTNQRSLSFQRFENEKKSLENDYLFLRLSNQLPMNDQIKPIRDKQSQNILICKDKIDLQKNTFIYGNVGNSSILKILNSTHHNLLKNAHINTAIKKIILVNHQGKPIKYNIK